ncbi:hypothetical protein BD779DRAFT_1464622 [Infundibulicybe gibba]|nr:hypothetical protein BD779DRAFT_1464622 [Infundibulicybe gibba]
MCRSALTKPRRQRQHTSCARIIAFAGTGGDTRNAPNGGRAGHAVVTVGSSCATDGPNPGELFDEITAHLMDGQGKVNAFSNTKYPKIKVHSFQMRSGELAPPSRRPEYQQVNERPHLLPLREKVSQPDSRSKDRSLVLWKTGGQSEGSFDKSRQDSNRKVSNECTKKARVDCAILVGSVCKGFNYIWEPCHGSLKAVEGGEMTCHTDGLSEGHRLNGSRETRVEGEASYVNIASGRGDVNDTTDI